MKKPSPISNHLSAGKTNAPASPFFSRIDYGAIRCVLEGQNYEEYLKLLKSLPFKKVNNFVEYEEAIDNLQIYLTFAAIEAKQWQVAKLLLHYKYSFKDPVFDQGQDERVWALYQKVQNLTFDELRFNTLSAIVHSQLEFLSKYIIDISLCSEAGEINLTTKMLCENLKKSIKDQINSTINSFQDIEKIVSYNAEEFFSPMLNRFYVTKTSEKKVNFCLDSENWEHSRFLLCSKKGEDKFIKDKNIDNAKKKHESLLKILEECSSELKKIVEKRRLGKERLDKYKFISEKYTKNCYHDWGLSKIFPEEVTFDVPKEVFEDLFSQSNVSISVWHPKSWGLELMPKKFDEKYIITDSKVYLEKVENKEIYYKILDPHTGKVVNSSIKETDFENFLGKKVEIPDDWGIYKLKTLKALLRKLKLAETDILAVMLGKEKDYSKETLSLFNHFIASIPCLMKLPEKNKVEIKNFITMLIGFGEVDLKRRDLVNSVLDKHDSILLNIFLKNGLILTNKQVNKISDQDGNTILHRALLQKEYELAHTLLVRFKASLLVKNRAGKEAWEMLFNDIKNNKNEKIKYEWINLLLQNGYEYKFVQNKKTIDCTEENKGYYFYLDKKRSLCVFVVHGENVSEELTFSELKKFCKKPEVLSELDSLTQKIASLNKDRVFEIPEVLASFVRSNCKKVVYKSVTCKDFLFSLARIVFYSRIKEGKNNLTEFEREYYCKITHNKPTQLDEWFIKSGHAIIFEKHQDKWFIHLSLQEKMKNSEFLYLVSKKIEVKNFESIKILNDLNVHPKTKYLEVVDKSIKNKLYKITECFVHNLKVSAITDIENFYNRPKRYFERDIQYACERLLSILIGRVKAVIGNKGRMTPLDLTHTIKTMQDLERITVFIALSYIAKNDYPLFQALENVIKDNKNIKYYAGLKESINTSQEIIKRGKLELYTYGDVQGEYIKVLENIRDTSEQAILKSKQNECKAKESERKVKEEAKEKIQESEKKSEKLRAEAQLERKAREKAEKEAEYWKSVALGKNSRKSQSLNSQFKFF